MQTTPRAVMASALLSMYLAAGAAGAQALTDAERAARADLVTRAQAAQRAGQLEEALAFVERAERIGPTAGIRFVTARIHQAAGRPVLALASVEQCLRDVDLDAQTTASNRDALRQACQTLRDELAQRVGRVTLRVPSDAPPGLVVRVAGEIVRPTNYNAPLRVAAGAVRVEAEAPQRAPWSLEVLVQSGATVPVDVLSTPTPTPAPPPVARPVLRPAPSPVVTLAPTQPPVGDAPPPPGRTQRVLGGVSLALGGVGLAMGAIAGAVLSSRSDDYQAAGCATMQTPLQSCFDDHGTLDTLHTLQWAGYVGGGVLAATGLIVLLTAPSRAPAVQVSLAPGAVSLTYGARF